MRVKCDAMPRVATCDIVSLPEKLQTNLHGRVTVNAVQILTISWETMQHLSRAKLSEEKIFHLQ